MWPSMKVISHGQLLLQVDVCHTFQGFLHALSTLLAYESSEEGTKAGKSGNEGEKQ